MKTTAKCFNYCNTSLLFFHFLFQFVAMIIMLNVVSFGYLMLWLIAAEPVEHRLACQYAVIASNVETIRTTILTCSCLRLAALAIAATHQL